MSNKALLSVLSAVTFSNSAGAATAMDGPGAYRPCAACHLPTGAGVPGMAPPLKTRLAPLAATQLGRDYLVLVADKGLAGELVVDGKNYNGVMPAHGASLGDAGVAAVLNHIMVTFNGAAKMPGWRAFTALEVATAKKRNLGSTTASIHNMRKSLASLSKER